MAQTWRRRPRPTAVEISERRRKHACESARSARYCESVGMAMGYAARSPLLSRDPTTNDPTNMPAARARMYLNSVHVVPSECEELMRGRMDAVVLPEGPSAPASAGADPGRGTRWETWSCWPVLGDLSVTGAPDERGSSSCISKASGTHHAQSVCRPL